MTWGKIIIFSLFIRKPVLEEFLKLFYRGAPVANQDDDLNQTGSGPAGKTIKRYYSNIS